MLSLTATAGPKLRAAYTGYSECLPAKSVLRCAALETGKVRLVALAIVHVLSEDCRNPTWASYQLGTNDIIVSENTVDITGLMMYNARKKRRTGDAVDF